MDLNLENIKKLVENLTDSQVVYLQGKSLKDFEHTCPFYYSSVVPFEEHECYKFCLNVFPKPEKMYKIYSCPCVRVDYSPEECDFTIHDIKTAWDYMQKLIRERYFKLGE